MNRGNEKHDEFNLDKLRAVYWVRSVADRGEKNSYNVAGLSEIWELGLRGYHIDEIIPLQTDCPGRNWCKQAISEHPNNVPAFLVPRQYFVFPEDIANTRKYRNVS